MSGAQARETLPDIVILAAGAGKRMKNGLHKALQPVFFRPMIHYVIEAAMALPHRSLFVVIGRGERELREQCRMFSELQLVRQEAPLGTADALRLLESRPGARSGNLLILNADTALLTAKSLQELLARHAAAGADCTFARGRADAGEVSLYFVRARMLFEALKKVPRGTPERESLLSEAIAGLAALGAKTIEYRFADETEALDINDQRELWQAETILRERFNREQMCRGVALQDPRTTLIDPRCRIEPGVRIEGGCTLVNSAFGAGALVESHCRIIDSEVGSGSLLRQGTVMEQSRVGRDCRVGPYARLRSGSYLDDDVWIGNFVEIKNASLGAGTRAAHLSFIGDAQVGRNVNIGCGFITCNSSGGPVKQRTVIEDNVFIGSGSQTIAPVTVGAGSFIATGTSVTDDVPLDSFVISRGRQVTKPGYAKKYGKAKGAVVPS